MNDQQQPNTQPGDQQDPEINMPVGKNELMLIGLALREYRYALSKVQKEMPNYMRLLLMQQITLLEAKVLSNEISWDDLFGSTAAHPEPPVAGN